jgi:protease-4
MKEFFKIVFASVVALFIFSLLGFFILLGFITAASSEEKPVVGNNAVLVIDLSQPFMEQSKENPLGAFSGQDSYVPSVFEVTELIRYARQDSAIKGIYLQAADNLNGFAASEEIRDALQDFKRAGKFIYAYGETMTQKAYYVANIANKVYTHPKGGLEWSGFASTIMFLKGTLEKLEIEPQIFYAGKFKSATEPLRETKMTDANRLQTSVWLGDLYNVLLRTTAEARKLDTAYLHDLANKGTIQSAANAVTYKLLDGVRYDDELKGEIKAALKGSGEINFVTINDYAKAADYKTYSGEKIAVIYAQGDIVSGEGGDEQIGSNQFRALLRKARTSKDVKAIVLRVNSPGGSALASDVIWRELELARKEKPVVVSMGDMAASGGYYISCNADAVFTNETTLTGSIGVFSIVPNMQSFFKNKLGITTDRVTTAPYADMGSSDRPLTETEKRFFQAGVDSIYHTFKSRVANGRKKNIEYVDSIGQGRVWTGTKAIEIGLADKIGTLKDAIAEAAKRAKLEQYRIQEYPETKTWFEELTGSYKKTIQADVLKKEMGIEEWKIWQQLKGVKQMVGEPQTRLPYYLNIH